MIPYMGRGLLWRLVQLLLDIGLNVDETDLRRYIDVFKVHIRLLEWPLVISYNCVTGKHLMQNLPIYGHGSQICVLPI